MEMGSRVLLCPGLPHRQGHSHIQASWLPGAGAPASLPP